MFRSFLFLVLLTGLFSCSKQEKSSLKIAAASNTRFAMEDIVMAFEKTSGVECDLITGSSGMLTAQIVEGAPFEVFVSADMKYPEFLEANNLADQPAKTYAKGQLVLWTMDNHLNPELSILSSPDIDYIAMANPKTAPYGQLADSLIRMHNLQDSLEEKLVFGENISQTTQFIQSGSAMIGFTSLSMVKSRNLRGYGSYQPMEEVGTLDQGAILLQGAGTDAKKFYNFLFSNQAKEILREYGYLTN